jgi:hypothetical protein
MMPEDLGGNNLGRAVTHPGGLEQPDDQPAYLSCSPVALASSRAEREENDDDR